MNDVLRRLYGRKSVRSFSDREIDESTVNEILTAAVMAPTAGNMQLYTILRITDDEIKERLSVLCDDQPFIAKGKLLLVFCADYLKWYDAFLDAGGEPRTPGPGDLMLAVNDALIAAQNSVTAAESYGIGSCYIGDVMENCEKIRELLQLPEYVFPAALLVFGYPTEQQQSRPKPPRPDLKYTVSENVYRRRTPEELRKMLGRGEGESPAEYRERIAAFCRRKYNSDFAREMSRSVREYLKQYSEESGQ